MKGRQNHHLTLLLTPAGAVHHPQKIGLNPTHPIQAEMVAAEVAMRRRKMTDGGAICLVHNYPFLIKLR